MYTHSHHLDEGPGEGWHRASNLSLQRACAAKTAWVLASTGHKQSLDFCRDFLKEHKEAGQQVFRYEWQHVKRVLQPTLRHKWRGVRMTDRAFYEKLYRLGEDYESWDGLLGDYKSGPPKPPPAPSSEAIKIEYLQHVYQPGGFYSYPVERNEMDAAGVLVAKTEEVIFQVISVLTSQNRPKRVPTAHDDADVITTSRVAVNLQYLEVWAKRSDVEFTCYFATESVYVNLHDVLEFNRVTTTMRSWDSTVSDTDNCVDIINPRLVHSSFEPLGDVPVFVPLQQLRRDGWDTVSRQITHTRDTAKIFDHRSASSKLMYFQVLLQLPQMLAINDTIVSGQPQAYYGCILHSVKVEPNQGKKVYVDMLKCFFAGKPMPAAALALGDQADDDDGNDALDDGNDDDDGDFAMGGGVAHPKRLPAAAAPKVAPAGPRAKSHAVRPAAIEDKTDASSSSSSDSKSSTSSSSSSDASSDASFEIHGMKARGFVGEFFELSNGLRVKLDTYKPKGKKPYQRLILKCPHHGNACEKKRNISHNRNCGKLEPIAFLCAWADLGAGISREEHSARAFKVPLDAVRSWVPRLGANADKLAEEF